MSQDILPDSRMKNPTGVKRIEFGKWGRINMEPIFCASCGKLGAYAPSESMTFAFWLCDGPCTDQWGTLAGTYTTSDEEFFKKVAAEAVERGCNLTEREIVAIEESSCNPLSKLLKESPLLRR
jgi:hypothetical protein